MEKVKKYEKRDQLFNKQTNSFIQLENDISKLNAIINSYDETKEENIKLMKQIKLIFKQIKTIKNELEMYLQKLQQMQKENNEFKCAIRDLKTEDDNVNLTPAKKQDSQVKNNELSSKLDVIFNEVFELFFQTLMKNRLIKSSYQNSELILHEIIYKNKILMESFKEKLEKYVCETIENKLYSKNFPETYIVLENSNIESTQNDVAINCQIDLNDIEIEKDFDIEKVVLKIDSLKNEIDKKNITLEELENEVLKLKENVTEKNDLIIELKYSKHNLGKLTTSLDSEANQINMFCKVDVNQKHRLQKFKIIATKQKQKIVYLKQSLENKIKKYNLEKNKFLNKLEALSKQKENGQFLEQQCHIKCDECDIKCNKINTWVNVFKGTKNNILELTKCCGVLKTNVKTLKNDLASTQKTTQNLKTLANLLSSNNEVEDHIKDIVSSDTEQNTTLKEFTINIKAVIDEIKLLKSELGKLQIKAQETNIHDSELISCNKSLDALSQKIKDHQLLSQNVEKKLSNTHYLIISIHEQIKHLEHIVIIEQKTNKQSLNEVNMHQTAWYNVESPYSENNNDLIVCEGSLNPEKIFNTNLTKKHEEHPKYKTDEDNYLFQRSQELNKTVKHLQIEIKSLIDSVSKHVEENQSIVDDLEVYKLMAISIYQKFKQDSMCNVKVAELSKQHLNKALNLFEASLKNTIPELLSKNKQILKLKNAINKIEMKLSNSTKSLLVKEKEVNCLNVEIENIKSQIVKEKITLNNKTFNDNSAQKKDIEQDQEIILDNKVGTVSTELNTDLPIIQNTLKESNFLHNNDSLLLDFSKSNGSVQKLRKSPFRSLEDLLSFEKNCAKDSISNLNYSEQQLTAMSIKTDNDCSYKVQTKNLKDDKKILQYCKERQKETPNMEYLKNIIMKFVTLPSGEEKCCLVPVMIKLLNLSLEEQKQMETVAKGALADKYSNWSDLFLW